uniref:Deoxyribonuclease-2-alpha n=1 Tax=Magallana gigas TaxID=29159 RepID=K1PZ27_MAGGI
MRFAKGGAKPLASQDELVLLEKKVINVKEVCFNNNITFSDGVDHSKWAVAKQSPWICIGDLNREEAQKQRGGLSVCLKDAIAAKEFRDLHDRCIYSMIKTANAKLRKRPKPPKRPVLGVKKKPLKKQKGRKYYLLGLLLTV